MDKPQESSKVSQDSTRAQALGADFSKISAVEQGAARGIGPLSPLGKLVWHGESRPCVSCGQLVRRTAARCDHCGQVLSGEMMYRMRQHSGPWYVHEHVRPFPGVSKQRLILQIKRGVLTPTTIIRGPGTHHQWRYAGETPGISRYLGICWACQSAVHEDDTTCPVCRKNLESDGEDVLIEGDETLDQHDPALDQLQAAVRSSAPRRRLADGPARIGRVPAWWIVTALVILLMAVVYIVARLRENGAARDAGGAANRVPLVLPDSAPVMPDARDD